MIIMKNIIKLSYALAAALCIISCNEKIGSEILESRDYITVSTFVAPHSKAGYEGDSVLPDNFFISIDQPGSSKDYNKTMSKVESSNQYIFPNNEKLEWASSDYSSVTIKAITTPSIKYDNTTYGYTRSTGNMIICRDQSTAERVEASDLLGAKTGDGIEINSGNVIVHFNHLMSKLYVKYNTSDVEVESILLNDVAITGSYNFENMTYSAPTTYGEIPMYHNRVDDTAEAIFFPGAPGKNLQLSVSLENGNHLNVPISLAKVGGTFLPGKRYIMNVTITGSSISGAEVTVSDWNPDITTITTPGENVLWVGTSIPAGNNILNYPEEVDKALTCSITNVAVGGSLVCPQGNANWINSSHYSNYYLKDKNGNFLMHKNKKIRNEKVALPMRLMGGGLSQTKEDIRLLYEERLKTVSNNDMTWVEYVLGTMDSLSYTNLIIPYIDGTISSANGGNCTTVILDHGFNDLSNMIFLAGVFRTGGEIVRGYECLRKLKDKEMSIESYEAQIKSNENTKNSLYASYIHAMAKVIKAIQDVAEVRGVDIKIIIGNYFSLYSPYVARQYEIQHRSQYNYVLDANNYKLVYQQDGGKNVTNPAYTRFPDYATFSNLICYYNEAIAGMFDLDIVNVYEHLTIPESMFWAGTTDYTLPVYNEKDKIVRYETVIGPDGNPVQFNEAFTPIVLNDPSKFCPDGVHPSNPAAVGAIAEIYIDHLDGIVGSRGQDHPSSSSSSVNTSSILGIDSWDEEIF